MTTRRSSPDYSLQTLRKGLNVLEVIARSHGDETLTGLAAQLDEPVTVVFRILKTLEETGYIEQDPRTKRYGLGLRVWEIGERALARLSIVEIARPILSRLTHETGDTSSLAVVRGGGFVYVATQEGREPLRAYVEPGSRMSLALPTASGRAILAFAAAELVDSVLAESLQQFTPLTVTGKKQLRAILEQTLAAGVAVVHGEYQQHLSSVAAPIFNGEGACIAAVAVSGITQRFEGGVLARIVTLVKAAADEVTQKLGGGRQSQRAQAAVAATRTRAGRGRGEATSARVR